MNPNERIGVSPAAADDRLELPTIRQYRMPAKVFHWLTAGLVLFMVSSGVIAKQLNDGSVSDLLFSLHKLTGALTLCVVLLRLCYRVMQRDEELAPQAQRRSRLHWTLYGVVVLVPLLGWSGVSDFGSREIFPGYSLPAIWPERAGYADLLFAFHAYLAFGLLALVAVHIGVAMQDYMMRAGVHDARD
jgi:cytochrome b561